MIVYILVILMLLFVYHRTASITDNRVREKFERRSMFCYVILLSLLAGVKYIEPATDMSGYMYDYEYSSSMPILYSLSRPDNFGYYTLSKIFSLTGLSYHFWFAFVEAIYFGSMMLFVYRFSNDRTFSMFLSFTISVFYFSLRGSKQTLGMGFTMFAMLSYFDKKYINAIIQYFIAYACHPSCLVLLVCPLLYKWSEKKNYMYFMVVLAIFSITFGSFLLRSSLSIIGSYHYFDYYLAEQKSYASYTTFIFYFAIFIFGWFLKNNYFQVDIRMGRFLFGTSLFCVVAQSFAQMNADFFRLAYYFVPFLVVFPANAINYSKSGNIYKEVLAVMTIFYCLYVHWGIGYKFM